MRASERHVLECVADLAGFIGRMVVANVHSCRKDQFINRAFIDRYSRRADGQRTTEQADDDQTDQRREHAGILTKFADFATRFANLQRRRFRPLNDTHLAFYPVADFTLFQLGHLPQEGKSFEFRVRLCQIADMDGLRIDKLCS
ncbi:MAG: hypothetical protein RIE84_14365 [Parvibaculum sp.]|jgi:hypothetical protein